MAAVVMVAQVGVGLAHGAALQRDAGFRVLAPGDGDRVNGGFLLAWSPGAYRHFAVTLNEQVPAPGASVKPSPTTVVTALTALRLQLASRQGGSPSARDWHRVVVVPLDNSGHRIGEQVLVVHLRSG